MKALSNSRRKKSGNGWVISDNPDPKNMADIECICGGVIPFVEWKEHAGQCQHLQTQDLLKELGNED